MECATYITEVAPKMHCINNLEKNTFLENAQEYC
jgi:hypothetical protein